MDNYISGLREVADKLEREAPLAADAVVILRRLSRVRQEGLSRELSMIVLDAQALVKKVDEVCG